MAFLFVDLGGTVCPRLRGRSAANNAECFMSTAPWPHIIPSVSTPHKGATPHASTSAAQRPGARERQPPPRGAALPRRDHAGAPGGSVLRTAVDTLIGRAD